MPHKGQHDHRKLGPILGSSCRIWDYVNDVDMAQFHVWVERCKRWNRVMVEGSAMGGCPRPTPSDQSGPLWDVINDRIKEYNAVEVLFVVWASPDREDRDVVFNA